MKKYHTALTIAGSDCSGGAGIQADLKTFSALGCYGMSVITALTAQNTQGVSAIYPIEPMFIRQQLESIFADIEVKAIKIGMLFSAEIIEIIKSFLHNHTHIPLVLDPVMVSKNGNLLLRTNAITALREELFPLATLITPNISEAEYILQDKINSPKTMEKAAREICDLGVKAVLLKGGHLDGTESMDCFFDNKSNKITWLKARKIKTKNTHGTGCTLSAAIAAHLARGESLLEAVKAAKEYITAAILEGSKYRLGSGHGPVHHLYR
jgi:hydroxymethylpyrimidine kinase/phosphomethylpyrimidine kinase